MLYRLVVTGVGSKEEDFVTTKILRTHYGSNGCPRYSDKEFAAFWNPTYVTLVTNSGDMWHSFDIPDNQSAKVISYGELIRLHGAPIEVRKELTT